LLKGVAGTADRILGGSAQDKSRLFWKSILFESLNNTGLSVFKIPDGVRHCSATERRG
jgi:hypothetical protein